MCQARGIAIEDHNLLKLKSRDSLPVVQTALQTEKNYQRKRDDNKKKFALFRGGLGREAGRKIVQNAIFHGKRHDNKILKVNILLSRNFAVMAQAPKLFSNYLCISWQIQIQTKIILKLIFRSRYRYSCSLQFGGGHAADKNDFGNNFYFIADTDTEKNYFRNISAMNSDKR